MLHLQTGGVDGHDAEIEVVRIDACRPDLRTTVPARWRPSAERIHDAQGDEDDSPPAFAGPSARAVLERAPSFASDEFYAFVIPDGLLRRLIGTAPSLPPPDWKRTTASLVVNGEAHPCMIDATCATCAAAGGGLVILPLDELEAALKPFTWCFGLTAASITIRFGYDFPVNPRLTTHEIELRPVLVMQPEGETARRFLAMAERVARGFPTWFAPAAPRGRVTVESQTAAPKPASSSAGLSWRSPDEAVEQILAAYERLMPRLRSNPHTRSRSGAVLGSAEQMRSFTAATAAHIAGHADEWTESTLDAGIRWGRRTFLPRRMLIGEPAGNRDTPENRAAAGFLLAVEAYLAGRLETRHPGNADKPSEIVRGPRDVLPGYVSGAAMLEAFAAHGARAAASEDPDRRSACIRQAQRAARLSASMRSAFPFHGRRLERLPPLTPVFETVPAYRELWVLMRAWFRLMQDGASAASAPDTREDFVLEALNTPKLYERLVVTVLLEGLQAMGLRLDAVERIDWPTHEATCANAWTFSLPGRPDAAVRLWYEPAVFAPGAVDRHGLALMRTTSWRLKPEGLLPGVPRSLPAHYAPDVVVMVEAGGVRRWLVADAKLRRPLKTVETEVARALLKYGVTTRPIDPADRMDAVRLMCAIPDASFPGMRLNDLAEGLGPEVEVEVVSPDAAATTLTDRVMMLLRAPARQAFGTPSSCSG